MSGKKPYVKIGALWEREYEGRIILSGSLGDASVSLFETRSENPKAPKYDIVVSPYEKKKKQDSDQSNMPF